MKNILQIKRRKYWRSYLSWQPIWCVIILFLASYCLFIINIPAHALSFEKNSDGTARTLTDYIKNYVDVPPGATDWKVFGATTSTDASGPGEGGHILHYQKPHFSPTLLALNGKVITVKGFMFPLGEDDKQTLFLFGPFPLNCPFHYHVGPALVIEAHADIKPVTFSYDPVTIQGKLELVTDDPDNNVFYRLIDAHEVKS